VLTRNGAGFTVPAKTMLQAAISARLKKTKGAGTSSCVAFLSHGGVVLPEVKSFHLRG
jgi:hypothetical protein